MWASRDPTVNAHMALKSWIQSVTAENIFAPRAENGTLRATQVADVGRRNVSGTWNNVP